MIKLFLFIFLFAIASPLWAGEKTLTPEPFDRFGGTYIQVDDKGNIWTAFFDLKGDIHIRNALKGGDLVVNEGREKAPGEIAFDVQGDNLYVVWREKAGGKKLWFRASRDGGKTLSDPVLLDGLKEPLPRIRISSNAKGDIFILYLSEAPVAGSQHNILFTCSHDFGSTFSEPKNLTLGYNNSIYPTLFSEGENVFMFSDSGKEEKRFMIFRRSTDGGRTWSEPMEIMEIGGVTVYIEPIKVGKRLHVLWLDIQNNEHIVGAAFSDDDGQTWKSKYLDDTRGLDIGLMRLAHDSEGHIYLAFSAIKEGKEKDKFKSFVMRSEDNGETWEKPSLLRHYPFDKTQAINPHIIAAEKGEVVAVWVDYRNIRSNLYMQYSKDYGKTWQEKDVPLEEPGRFNTAHYPLKETLVRVGDTYYDLAYRFQDDHVSAGKADLLLIDFKPETRKSGDLKTTGKTMMEDPGSPEKIALLRERANDFWNASVKKDYDKVYSLYDPFFRTKKPDKSVVIGNINYHKSEVKDIHVEGNVATVTISIVYSIPGVRMKVQVFSVTETPAEFQEKWLYIYDNWYKEYYSDMMGKGVATY